MKQHETKKKCWKNSFTLNESNLKMIYETNNKKWCGHALGRATDDQFSDKR